MAPRTLYDKIFDDHVVDRQPDGTYAVERFFETGAYELKFVADGNWATNWGDGGDERLSRTGGNASMAPSARQYAALVTRAAGPAGSRGALRFVASERPPLEIKFYPWPRCAEMARKGPDIAFSGLDGRPQHAEARGRPRR